MKNVADAYTKFSSERFPLPSPSQLDDLEQRIGVAFPDDYRVFVLHYNGGYFNRPDIAPVVEGCPQEGLTSMFGIGASHTTAELARPRALALFDNNDPPNIVPIGNTPMGSLIILVTEPEGRGQIYLKEAFGDFYYLADGIEEFFELLKEAPPEQDG